MESYTAGLGAFDISAAPQPSYDMAPFEDIDFSDFIHAQPAETQYAA